MSTIVAVHSFRRAAGRTSLVANLAALLAGSGSRVGVLDLDFQSPSLHLLFGLQTDDAQMTLNNYLWGECRFEAVGREIGRSGIVVLPASTDSADIARMLRTSYSSEGLDSLVQELEARYGLDVLLLDTAAGLNEETLLPMVVADALVVVMRPDQQDYQGTAVLLDVAASLEVPRMALVLNYTPAEFKPAELVRELQATYDCRVATLLPYSEKLSKLASRGILAWTDPSAAYIRQAGRLLDWILADG